MPDELIGQGDVVKGNYSKQERCAQILRFLNDGKIRSTSEVARALKMQNATAFRKLLLDMYARGEVRSYCDSVGYRWQSNPLIQLPMFDDEKEGV